MNKKLVLSVLSTAVVASMATSAFAAPKAGVYLGGNIKKFYALDTLFSLNASAKTEFSNYIAQLTSDFNQVVYVDTNGKGASIQEILTEGYNTALQEALVDSDFADSYTEIKADGTSNGSYEPKKDLPQAPATELKVESVSVLNAKQIEVKFNTAVDEDTAIDVTNYAIKRAGAAAVSMTDSVGANDAEAVLSDDEKTVTITLANTLTSAAWGSIAEGDSFLIQVSGIKDKAGKTITATSKDVKYSDKVAPTFVSASAKAKVSTNTITLKFSEPVVPTSGIVKVNGVGSSVAAGVSPNELVVTTGATLTAGQSYNIEIISFKDYAGNLLNPSYVTSTVTVTADNVAPVVSNVAVVSDNIIEVTFDKSMDPSSISTATVSLVDANYNNLNAGNVTGITPKTGTSNKTFRITLDNTPALPFNASNVFNGTLIFTDTIQDAYGNKINPVTKPVTITKDTTKPSVASMRFIKADTTPGKTYGGVSLANGAIVIKFNEKVSKLATTNTGFVLVDNSGTDVTGTFVTNTEVGAARVNPDDTTELVIPLKRAITAGDAITSLTVRIPTGVAADLSLSANTSEAGVSTINVESGSNTTDTTKPTVAYASTGAGNVINLNITEQNQIDTASVLDLNNYRLNGAPLPNGTYITISTKVGNVYPVSIHLPAGTTTQTGNYVLNVSGIKDSAGNVMNADAFANVSLTDDVQPELSSASLSTDGTINLQFSETLATHIVPADLVITMNNKALAGSYTVTPVVNGKYFITVSSEVYNGPDATSGTADDILYIDVDDNNVFSSVYDIQVGSGAAVVAGPYNLNNSVITSIKVKTAASGITGADATGNTVKTNTEKTVK